MARWLLCSKTVNEHSGDEYKEPAMNRIFNNNSASVPSINNNPMHRPGRQLRQETETMLRDLAYVLQLTRRVKEEILEEREEVVGV